MQREGYEVNQLWVADITYVRLACRVRVFFRSAGCIFRGGPWAGRWGGVGTHIYRWWLWKTRSAAGNPELGWAIIPTVGHSMPATRNNGITEGFHNRMEMISRQAFGFRNFDNYRVSVKVLCGLCTHQATDRRWSSDSDLVTKRLRLLNL